MLWVWWENGWGWWCDMRGWWWCWRRSGLYIERLWRPPHSCCCHNWLWGICPWLADRVVEL